MCTNAITMSTDLTFQCTYIRNVVKEVQNGIFSSMVFAVSDFSKATYKTFFAQERSKTLIRKIDRLYGRFWSDTIAMGAIMVHITKVSIADTNCPVSL